MAKKKKALTAGLDKTFIPFANRNLHLGEMRLAGMVAGNNLKGDDSSAGPVMPDEISLGTRVQSRRVDEHHIMVFMLTFTLEGKYEGSDEAVLQIHATYAIAYHVDSLDGINDKQIHEFGQRSGVMHLWPLWRELVMSTMNRMSLPAFVIPLLHPGSLTFQPTPLAADAAAKKDQSKPTKKRPRR